MQDQISPPEKEMTFPFLIDAEKWGAIKRWSDFNFCKRLREMQKKRADQNLKVHSMTRNVNKISFKLEDKFEVEIEVSNVGVFRVNI